MDVGFNNTNTLHIALEDNYLEDVEWIVEATSEERHNIWDKWHERHNWEQVSSGRLWTIINLEVKFERDDKKVIESLPVTLDVSYAILDGHKILFYDSPSRLVHLGYIEAFMHTYFQRTHDNYSRWNHTNSANFHNCAYYLDTIDTKPRNTTFEPYSNEEYYVFKPIKIKKHNLNKKLKKVKNTVN